MSEKENIDHRQIGSAQELFFFHDLTPGSAFWLPKGMRIYNKLQECMRKEYVTRGFSEVKAPIIAKKELWEISGHWDKYKENMFSFSIHEDDKETDIWAIKAMNCPLHCLMFNMRDRSYKELPLRLADFGPLHRNEISGSLTGLTRVRNFHQDDAHIFCTTDQVKSEIKQALQFVFDFYNKFGFELEIGFSTRPENFKGEINIWNYAEKQLVEALNESNIDWILNEGDGAFYGPKIDICLKDSLNRKHQCATIQLDFQLPSEQSFNCRYVDENNTLQNCVIVHRAIYGSFERFIAILCEHFEGKWPLWISPNQIQIIPLSDEVNSYANLIYENLHNSNFYVDIDNSDNTMQKKIYEANKLKYNYILIIGKKEMESNTLSIRCRNGTRSISTLDDFKVELNQNIDNFSL